MKKRVVVALGHRALGTTLPEQKTATKSSAKYLADLVEEGCQLIISHSNAPQVGMIHTALNEYAKLHETDKAPMSVCSAMSQGYIGYDLQNAIRSELLKRGIYKPVCSIITQVLVDPYDEAFYHPVKVIGRYLTAEEAAAEEKKGNHVVEDPGKGFRRIISSPKPVDIIEKDSIRALSDAGHIVIACGGGGIPVLRQGTNLKGASAVIEKDRTAGKLAEATDADILMIFTNEPFVSIGFGTDREESLGEITAEEAKAHIAANEFGEASMLPKIEASVSFVNGHPGRRAVITSIDCALDALQGKTGTIIRA